MYLMGDAAAALEVPVLVASAGVAPLIGAPGCDAAPALRGRAHTHRSKPVTADAVAGADLILTAAREHQARVTDLDPSARSRTYTVRQAARIARWMLDVGMPQAGWTRNSNAALGLPPDDPRSAVSPLGEDWAAWVVEEMDAARGLAPVPHEETPDDIIDPHAGRPELHTLNYQQIWDATNSLAILFQTASRLAAAG